MGDSGRWFIKWKSTLCDSTIYLTYITDTSEVYVGAKIKLSKGSLAKIQSLYDVNLVKSHKRDKTIYNNGTLVKVLNLLYILGIKYVKFKWNTFNFSEPYTKFMGMTYQIKKDAIDSSILMILFKDLDLK